MSESRSVQKRVALQKGEPMPTFASGGVLSAEQREELLRLAGDCWDCDWDVNQGCVDDFLDCVNALLAAHDQKVREQVCEGCGIPHLKLVSICAQCIRTTSIEARKLERAKVLEEAAQVIKKWNFMACSDADELEAEIRALASRAEEPKDRASREEEVHNAYLSGLAKRTEEEVKG